MLLFRRGDTDERTPGMLGVFRYPVLDVDGFPVDPPRERYGWTCRTCPGDGGWTDITGRVRDAWYECMTAGSEHLMARHPEWVQAAKLRMLVVENARSGSSLPVLASDVPMPAEVTRSEQRARRAERRRMRRATRRDRWWLPGRRPRWDDEA